MAGRLASCSHVARQPPVFYSSLLVVSWFSYLSALSVYLMSCEGALCLRWDLMLPCCYILSTCIPLGLELVAPRSLGTGPFIGVGWCNCRGSFQVVVLP